MEIVSIEKAINSVKRCNSNDMVFHIGNGFLVMNEIANNEYSYSLFFGDVFKKDFNSFDALIDYKRELVASGQYGVNNTPSLFDSVEGGCGGEPYTTRGNIPVIQIEEVTQ